MIITNNLSSIYRILNYFKLIALFFLLFNSSAYGAKLEDKDYFASLRAGKVNVRSGPGTNYPIKYTFKMRGIPVKVISKYDNWNEIKDFDGDSGWINQNLLTKKRTIIVKTKKDFINLHLTDIEKSKILLRLENNVIADFIKCNKSWCGVKVSGEKGWVLKEGIWGIDDKDNIK